MKTKTLLLIGLLVLLTGCSSVAYYPGTVNCRKSLQSDLLRLFAIDEFSLEYTRNTLYYCNDGDCPRPTVAQAPSRLALPPSSVTDVQVQSAPPATGSASDGQPLVKGLR